jgi:hypothetical protein
MEITGSTRQEVFDAEGDYSGLKSVLTEIVSVQKNKKEGEDWWTAEIILRDFEQFYVQHQLTLISREEQNRANRIKYKLVRELISANAERLHGLNPNRDSETNWFAAQTELAYTIYFMYKHKKQRRMEISKLTSMFTDSLTTLKDYQEI